MRKIDKIPVVLHRWDRGPWLVVVPLDDLPELARLLLETDVDTSPQKVKSRETDEENDE